MNSVLSSRARILSLWLPRLPTDRIERQRAHEEARERLASTQAEPLAVYAHLGNADILIAVNTAAQALGLHVGLALAQARAMYPALATMEQEEHADMTLLGHLADWCGRYTPLVAPDPPDGVLLDIGGCAHLFGGEARLADDMSARLARFGFAHRIAIAGTIGAAWAASRYGDEGVYASGNERALLAPLPLAALRLPGDQVAALARVGLKTVSDILDLPRAPLAARFGASLLCQRDRALGDESEPLTPLLPLAPYVAEQRFHEPIAREDDVLAVIGRLAARLKTVLEKQGDGARLIALDLFRTDGAVKRVQAGTSRPLRDPRAMTALFVERLAALGDEIDPGFGFDLARLSVLVAEPCAAAQIGFGGVTENSALDHLVDRLSARLGAHRVRRIVAQGSHIPELAAFALPAQHSDAGAQAEGWNAFRDFRNAAELAARPLRLLARPEPIEAGLDTVPDGPPLYFSWRRARHVIVAAEGPERIEGQWWSEEGGPARDYFRVEDEQGLRFWLFRAGLYRNRTPEDGPTPWFMHGLFA